jgi:replicative DNA helicase
MISLGVENLDSITVLEKLPIDEKPYLQELIEDSDSIVPGTSNVLYYAEEIKAKSKLRDGVKIGSEISLLCFNGTDAEDTLQKVEDMFAKFIRKRIIENKSESTVSAYNKFIEALRVREPEDPNAIKTGFESVDLTIGKLEELVILAGRPGSGKTAWCINIILNVLKTQPVLFFSLEQKEEQVFERMLAAYTKTPLTMLRQGLADVDPTVLAPLMERFHLDDRANVPTSYITSVARQKAYEWKKIGLIVVDYLNLIELKGEKRVEALGTACKELRGLSKELDCPVLLLAQLNRGAMDQGKNKRPELHDLRDSGEIEQMADQVFFLWRESYNNLAGTEPDEDIVEVHIKKNRNGPLGLVELRWLPFYTRFEDLR